MNKRQRDIPKGEKKNPTHSVKLEVGWYVKPSFSNRSYKIVEIDKKGIFLDMHNTKPVYVTKVCVIENNFVIYSKFHIKTLQRECKRPTEIASRLLRKPIAESRRIIRASGYNPNDPRPMKKMLVPCIFTESQWTLWLKRFKSIPNPIKKQVPVANKQNKVPKQKKPSRSRIKQVEAARKLTEDAKRHKDAVMLVGEEKTPTSKYVVKPQDFMIKVQNFSCISKGHKLESVQAEIVIRSHNGKGITSKLIPAGYCQQCKHYYILSSIYEEYYFLMKDALCDFVNEQHLSKFLDERSIREKYLDFKDYKNESVLKKCGYSVSQKDDLRDYERLQILESIIKDYKILSKQEVMTFINWLIRQHQSNPLQIHAIQKWKADLLAIAGIENKDVERVHVKLIKYT